MYQLILMSFSHGLCEKKLSIIKKQNKNKNKTKNQKEGIKHLNASKLTVSWGKIIV